MYGHLLFPLVFLLLGSLVLNGCATRPPPLITDKPQPQILLPTSLAGIEDHRAAFRRLFCTINAGMADTDPEYRPCDEALSLFAGESLPPPDDSVSAAATRPGLRIAVVLGLGWDCLHSLLEPRYLPLQHLKNAGYEVTEIHVDGLSGSSRNAREIRDALLTEKAAGTGRNLVLVGYSKGAVDILEAVGTYPEVAKRTAAMISIAGSIGGSPLADGLPSWSLQLLRSMPGATCDAGDGNALDSLRPQVRQQWLAEHPLPDQVRFYSLVTAPEPGQVSLIMRPGQKQLGQADPRNDGNLLPQDQVIPGSALLGYVNADHWAVALPVARSNPTLGKTLVDHNEFPRDALWEAVIHYVTRDLARHHVQ